uniref:Uncharacterized protein n=1 Tax=viral metagenome TaxID=1070528 RepID=A0A6C0CC90_9ZZZZ
MNLHKKESDNTKNIPILVCKSRVTGRIISTDPGDMCRPQFFFFGKLVPKYDCGDELNIHECFMLSKNDLAKFKNTTSDE